MSSSGCGGGSGGEFVGWLLASGSQGQRRVAYPCLKARKSEVVT